MAFASFRCDRHLFDRRSRSRSGELLPSGLFDALPIGEWSETLASLRALVSERVQAGHTRLHAGNVALQAGAPTEPAEEVAARMVAEEGVRGSRARAILMELEPERSWWN